MGILYGLAKYFYDLQLYTMSDLIYFINLGELTPEGYKDITGQAYEAPTSN